MENPRIIVIGGVAAGMSAASQAKRRRPEAEVIVFERGNRISYGACGMPYNIEDPSRDIEDLVVLTPEKAIGRGIDLRLRHEVVALDNDRRTVTVKNLQSNAVQEETYDRLVIATGASAIRLPLPGFDLEGICHLRDLSDGRHIKSVIAEHCPSKAVIVGAGYIGMEMAHVLTELGLTVTVLERLDQVIPGWDAETVSVVLEELQAKGVAVHTSATVTGAIAGPDGRVKAVATDGSTFEADIVISAVGIRPQSDLAARSGLRLGEGGAIWVDQYQQTSAEQVWAAGDCSEAYHRILRRNTWIPLGTTANKQGRIAGANATGERLMFGGITGTAGFQVFDLEVARTGLGIADSFEEGFDPVSVTIKQRSRAHGYPDGVPVQVTLIADRPTGLVLGGELVGQEGAALRTNVLATALASHLTVSDLQELDLVYAPPFASVWDPILVAANQLIKRVGKTA